MPIRNILVVEDSATDRHFLSELLAKHGYTVWTAESAEEAFAKIRQAQPDLVLMDVLLPGQNGYQATRTLTRGGDTRHIPVIICTTRGQESDRVWGMRQGARDYVVKPVKQAELIDKITALRSWPGEFRCRIISAPSPRACARPSSAAPLSSSAFTSPARTGSSTSWTWEK